MKLLCFLLSALLQYTLCSANPKDKECVVNTTFPTVQAQDIKTRNLLAAVDIKHAYDEYPSKEKRTEKTLRIMLKKGEARWVYLRTSFNNHANPRTLYIHFNGERVLASMASYHDQVTYMRDLVETTHKWSCINWSLKKGQSDSKTFSTYHSISSSRSELYFDRVEIDVLPGNVPLGPSKDLECFEKQFPSVHKASSKQRLRVNITKMFYKQVGVSRWCCRDTKEKSIIVNLVEGQKKVISLKYLSIINSIATSEQMKIVFKDENPRNLTMILSNGMLHVGMARLKETAFYDSYSYRWMYDSSWACVNITVAIDSIRRNTTQRLDFSMYYVFARTASSIQKRKDYVLMEISRAGVMSSSATILIASSLVTVLGKLLHI